MLYPSAVPSMQLDRLLCSIGTVTCKTWGPGSYSNDYMPYSTLQTPHNAECRLWTDTPADEAVPTTLFARRVAAADRKRTVQEDYEELTDALEMRQTLVAWMERAKQLELELLESRHEIAKLALDYDLG